MHIRIIDLETTGVESSDHVVEFGSVDLFPDGSIARFQQHLVKPPCSIPPEARAVHHISNEDVSLADPWHTVCNIVFNRNNCSDLVAFAAHNASFDQKWLPPDLLGNLPVICTYKAAVHIWPEAPRHTNQILRYWLGLDMDRSLADQFVGMYVNAWTLDYGERGRAAVTRLLEEGHKAGIIPTLTKVEFVE